MGFFQDVDVSKIRKAQAEAVHIQDEEEPDFSDNVFMDDNEQSSELVDELIEDNNDYFEPEDDSHIINEYRDEEGEDEDDEDEDDADDNEKKINYFKKSEKEKSVKTEAKVEKEGRKTKMQANDKVEAGGTSIGMGSIVDGDLTTKGILSIDGRVNGDVKSDSCVTIFKHGFVEGNVTAGDKLTISGIVRGNVTAKEIDFDHVKLTGNVTAAGKIKITKGTIIKGNIDAKAVIIDGAVMGDIDVQGPVALSSSAVVKGTIKSSSLQMENGAVIDGMCQQCYGNNDAISIFDEEDDEE